jgi:ComF family protein
MKKRELAGRVFVAFHYGSIARGLVHQMKFYGREDVAYLLGVEAGRGFLKWQRDLPFGAVVPVPLHPVRLRERGYDQNLSLARGVAEKLDLPVRTGLIFRNRNTRAQSRLSDVERITNLSGSFRPASTRGETVPQRVLLVDDVIHTGATVSECIQALLMTGVDDVKVLAACG